MIILDSGLLFGPPCMSRFITMIYDFSRNMCPLRAHGPSCRRHFVEL